MEAPCYKTILTAGCCLIAAMITAQPFQQIGSTGAWETQSNVDKIGIGDFVVGTPPQAALHVDGNLLNTPTGSVFLTDAPSGTTTWQMFRQGIEYGRIYNANNDNFEIMATRPSSEIRFHANGNTAPTMIIEDGAVGIGTTNPSQKLHVSGNIRVHDIYMNSGRAIWRDLGIRIDPDGGGSSNTDFYIYQSGKVGVGLDFGVIPSAKLELQNTTEGIGILGITGNLPATFPTITQAGNIGIAGQVADAPYNFGGVFEAEESNGLNIGVYARGEFAGFFVGSVTGTGPGNFASDIIFKDSLQDISNALATLNNISPKQYVFRTDSFPYLNFPENDQYGLIAQQLDSVSGVAAMVGMATHPQIRDSAGNLLMDSLSFKTINYTGLIPLLVSGVNELNSAKVSPAQTPTVTDSNYVTKWDAANNTITNSIIYDTGERLGIGTTTPIATVDIQNADSAGINVEGQFVGGVLKGGLWGASGIATGSYNSQTGIYGRSDDATEVNTGVMGKADASVDSALAVGVLGLAEGSGNINIGIFGISHDDNATSINTGILGRAEDSEFENFGGRFQATGTTGTNYGIYAQSLARDSSYAGYFQGPVVTTGALINGASDVSLQDSIEDISGALDILAELQPKAFTYKTDSFPGLDLPTGMQVGFTSQQVDSTTAAVVLVHDVVTPQASDSLIAIGPQMSLKGVDYMSVIPLLVSGVNELSNDKVSSCQQLTETNYVTKWDSVNKQLCTGVLYDDGENVGVGTINPQAKLEVQGDSIGILSQGTFTGIHALGDSVGGSFMGYEAGVVGEGDLQGGLFQGQEAGAIGFGDGNDQEEYTNGVIGVAENATFMNAGLRGVALGETDSAFNIGALGSASGSEFSNIGFSGSVISESATAVNTGVGGLARNSGNVNYGGYFTAPGDSGDNFAVYAYAADTDSSYAGLFKGDVAITGTLYNPPSDRMLKRNEQSITDALSVLLQLQPKGFEYKRQDYPYMNLPEGTQYGLIADETENVLPGLVKEIINPEHRDENGNVLSPQIRYKGINYVGLIPLLLGAIQEQQSKIGAQNSVIDSLSHSIDERLLNLEVPVIQGGMPQQQANIQAQQDIIDSLLQTIDERLANLENNCCQSEMGYRYAAPEDEGRNDEEVNHLTVELSSTRVVVLEQNVPNPFAEQTSISYFIPEDAKSANIIFFDTKGRHIKTVEVEKGYGIMSVFAHNLSTGTYSYSLVLDGEVVETKRMVKSR